MSGLGGRQFKQWTRAWVLLLLVLAAVWTLIAARSRTAAPAAAPVQLEEPAPAAPVQTEESAPPEAEKLIALTFDDGPSSVNTPKLLDALAQRGVHATFFLVGSMVENDPALAVRIALEGHQIAIHAYDHNSANGLRGLSDTGFDQQVGRTQRLLTQLTGQTQFALRPPYGFVDSGVQQRSPGPIILWSVDPEDWKYRNTAKVTQHILSHAKDGSIVLLHDIFGTSVNAAIQVVDALQAQGWRFVTVDELFALRGEELQRGEVYHCAYP